MIDPTKSVETIRFPFTVSLPLWKRGLCLISSFSVLFLGFYVPYWVVLQGYTFNIFIYLPSAILWMFVIAYAPGLLFIYGNTSLQVHQNLIRVRKWYGIYQYSIDLNSLDSFERYKNGKFIGFRLAFGSKAEGSKRMDGAFPLNLPSGCSNLDKLEAVLKTVSIN